MARTDLNFNRGQAALGGWRLALLVTGVLALFGAALDWTWQARITARLEQQLAQVQPRPQPRAALSASAQRDQDQQLRQVAEAVRQLNLPVGRLMRSVQAPPDIRVALLALDLHGGAGEQAGGALKISAEAQSAPDMMNYVAYLGERAMFASVYLVKHEIAAGAPGKPYRFQLEAQWRN